MHRSFELFNTLRASLSIFVRSLCDFSSETLPQSHLRRLSSVASVRLLQFDCIGPPQVERGIQLFALTIKRLLENQFVLFDLMIGIGSGSPVCRFTTPIVSLLTTKQLHLTIVSLSAYHLPISDPPVRLKKPSRR